MSTCREIRWMWLRRLQPNPVWDSLDLARLARHPLNDTSPESPPCNHHSNFSETENTFHAARHSSFLRLLLRERVPLPHSRGRRDHRDYGSDTINDDGHVTVCCCGYQTSESESESAKPSLLSYPVEPKNDSTGLPDRSPSRSMQKIDAIPLQETN